ncbi:inhibitor of growth protein 1-like protein [Leptotrombidium deliense]|uniref:Inhibitor of growth protein n=1 Tax=Leptotrombidium deliense TaxID=299467 RepID=A0A443SNV0_9ACAR|nr:inhibitor of growth protein 1-like protein [Leptotrombidium deliense]
MWSSSAYVCPTAEADGSTIHSIAQYIEDYIDLVENVPNEVIRQVTFLHEHNHRYQQLLATLESMWESVLSEDSSNNENRRKKCLLNIQRCLIEIQEISDEKLFIIQSVLDQLDSKARQLDSDYRNTNTANSVNSVTSPSKNNSVTVNNVNNATASSSCSDTLNSVNNSENMQASGDMNSNKDSCSLNNSTPTATSPTSNSTSHPLNSKRTSRRSLNSGKNDNGNGDVSVSTGKRGVKRGIKAHNKEVKRGKGKDVTGNSPPTLYDDTPIDPDEPTYCLCEQVSFGEMICCDNDACTIEWFHFSCVMLTTKPKGRWYCPNCRGDRSNIPKK